MNEVMAFILSGKIYVLLCDAMNKRYKVPLLEGYVNVGYFRQPVTTSDLVFPSGIFFNYRALKFCTFLSSSRI